MPKKRKPKKRRAPVVRRPPKRSPPVRKRKPAPKKRKPAPKKRKKVARAPPKKRSRPKSAPPSRSPRKKKKRRIIPTDLRDSDMGDVVVSTDDWEPVEDYRSFPIPGSDTLQELADRALAVHGEIEWFARFDEVYDYIDALVDEFDLDAHELFELAFGYSDEATV